MRKLESEKSDLRLPQTLSPCWALRTCCLPRAPWWRRKHSPERGQVRVTGRKELKGQGGSLPSLSDSSCQQVRITNRTGAHLHRPSPRPGAAEGGRRLCQGKGLPCQAGQQVNFLQSLHLNPRPSTAHSFNICKLRSA